ncbi:glycosyltransferase family 2 protein [Winogradskyella aurantiaca]|uniref:glycosyltransferase family 2 protein n=1 Tax=Winogradskyella aurantiaca TaxID=2219558 RepID=UPI000E1DB7C4|nr:glycosyltransferase family A protein [Winogradskyella aurantiaca]
MKNRITIIYAYRDRNVELVENSLQSLIVQSSQDFSIVFVDYGSQANRSQKLKTFINEVDNISYYYVGHPGLLWNKSKALNYGIRSVQSDFVLTADVDVLFPSNFIECCHGLLDASKFTLFKIAYLTKSSTSKLKFPLDILELGHSHIGQTFGIGLYPRAAFESVSGYDEFFHFYGFEDEDINNRLVMSGCTQDLNDTTIFHQWHEKFPRQLKNELSVIPRYKHALRLNQQHFVWNKSTKRTMANTKQWGQCWNFDDLDRLKNPDQTIKLNNNLSVLNHFFEVQLMQIPSKVVKIEITESPIARSLKFKLKSLLNKTTQVYLNMSEVNDLILKQIVFKYSDHNYSFRISEDLKRITLIISL